MNTVNQNLQIILDKFKEMIKPEEFDFGSFVEKFDYNNNCGTVCCVAGWFPRMFPNSGFVWQKLHRFAGSFHFDHPIGDNEEVLMRLIGTTDQALIDYLFFGIIEEDSFKENFLPKLPLLTASASKGDLITAWQYVIDNYDENAVPESRLAILSDKLFPYTLS